MNAKQLFINWVQENDPFLFEVAKKRFAIENSAHQLNGIGDFFGTLVDTVKGVAPTLIQYKSQKKILDLQIERAKQNLPPLDASSYTPTVKVAAEITPETEQAAQRIAVKSVREGVQGMQKYFFIGMLGVGAFLLLNRRR